MAFCGQCGLLLTTNTTHCPRCGAEIDPTVVLPETPIDNNSATIIGPVNTPGRASYTPSPPMPGMPFSDAAKTSYYTEPGGNSYPAPGTFPSVYPQNGPNYTPLPNSVPQGYIQPPQSGMYQPGVFPGTDPSYPFQAPIPPRKTRKWPLIFLIVLVVALIATAITFLALGTNQFAGLFGTQNTPTVQTPSITQSATTPQITPTADPTQQAQATVQHYYDDINKQDYQSAYNLWVTNSDTYTHFQQGFAHTHHDNITLGTVTPQVDGTIQVQLTVQATQDAAGGGTQVSTYQGYYTVGQQADGNWKIINGQLNPA